MKDSIFWTIISGVMVFAASQYILKLILEPIASLRRILSNISSTILFYQARLTNARSDDEISKELKRLSASLRASIGEICCYRLLYMLKIFGLPRRAAVFEACRELNALSHGMNQTSQQANANKDWPIENTKAIHRIGELLGVDTNY